MRERSIIFQPYYNWKGHFKKYTESLYSKGDLILTLGSHKDFYNFFSYAWLRFFLYFKLLVRLRCEYQKGKYSKVFFVEFEPISILVFFGFIKKIPVSVFTIHSVESCNYDSFLKNLISYFQRRLFRFSIKKLAKINGVFFIVHSEFHKSQLTKVIGSDRHINVIDYPSPKPNFINLKSSKKKSLLIFGAMRRDKQLYNFIKDLKQYKYIGPNLEFVFLGKIFDGRITSLKKELPESIKIVDKFVSEEELVDYVKKSHFFLLPYGSEYTGGAGPLKDAASYGRPVIASNIPFFIEQSKSNKFTIIFDKICDIVRIVESINSEEYSKLSSEAKKYSTVNNWSTLRVNYNEVL